MSETLHVLLVEDTESDAALILRHLKQAGYTLHSERVEEPEAMRQALSGQRWDIILADYRLPRFDAAQALRIRNECAEDVPFIIVSGTIGEDSAVEMMRAGAQDYVLKDRLARLAPAVRRETQEAQARRDRRREYQRLEEQLSDTKQNVEAGTLATQRSLLENTSLLQEVHHRVRNNLQVMGSLLSTQIAGMAGDDRSTAALQKAHHRVLALSLVHEQLYRSNSFSDIDFGEYVELLAGRLYFVYCVDPTRVRLETFVEPVHLTMDDAIQCGLILNELLANSLTHAFPQNREGVIKVRFTKIGAGRAQLSVADDGIGLPAGFRYQDVQSLGLTLVPALIAQLEGNLHVSGNGGTTFVFDWGLGKTLPGTLAC